MLCVSDILATIQHILTSVAHILAVIAAIFSSISHIFPTVVDVFDAVTSGSLVRTGTNPTGWPWGIFPIGSRPAPWARRVAVTVQVLCEPRMILQKSVVPLWTGGFQVLQPLLEVGLSVG